ncbi:MAG: hypothetical protein ACLPQS_17815 [Acidimicrobiales bacterium]
MSDLPKPAGPPARPWPKVGRTRRYGPVGVLMAAIIAAGTIASIHDRATTVAGGQPTSTTAPQDNSKLPITYAMAKKEGKVASYKWQTGCDPKTGRVAMPTPYAPPCVPAFTGNNGGSTWSGVTSKVIKVVYYISPPGDLTSALPNASDPQPEINATGAGMVAMFDKVYELYGRKLELIPFQGTGISTDAVAARADAITVAKQIDAFASIGGPGQTDAYENELAQLHVLCVSCGISVAYSTFKADAPYLWDTSADPDTLLTEALQFVVSQLLNKDAVYAGDPAYHHEKRVFGFVHYNTNPPVFSSLTAYLTKEFGKSGLKFKISPSYLLDLSTLPQEAATIVTQLKAAGVTTVVFAGDPIMPIYLTAAAAKADYYPEWVITGTVFTDSSTLGRYYTQSEWSHAFGVSSLAVLTPIYWSLGWTLYRWWYGKEPPAPKTGTLVAVALMQLYTGLQLAGPDLTPYTFQGGMFRYPPTGGGPTTPLIAYGPSGGPPSPAYTTPDDYTIIWWDATAKGDDDEGVSGTGLIRYVDGGRRYNPRDIPTKPILLFNDAGTVLRYNVPPGTHSAPPFPGSPMAAKT